MFYEVILNGTAMGQDIRNILFYRTGVGIDYLGLSLAGADVVAGMVKAQLWDSAAPLTNYAMRDVMPSSYRLEGITVVPRDNGFQFVYQNPYTLAVNEDGTANADTNSVGQGVVMKFNLEPTPLLQQFVAPKTGWCMFSPVSQNHFLEDGRITTEHLAYWTQFGVRLSENLESLVPPLIIFPIRVRRVNVGGILSISGWADVNGCAPRPLSGYLKRRQPEA